MRHIVKVGTEITVPYRFHIVSWHVLLHETLLGHGWSLTVVDVTGQLPSSHLPAAWVELHQRKTPDPKTYRVELPVHPARRLVVHANLTADAVCDGLVCIDLQATFPRDIIPTKVTTIQETQLDTNMVPMLHDGIGLIPEHVLIAAPATIICASLGEQQDTGIGTQTPRTVVIPFCPRQPLCLQLQRCPSTSTPARVWFIGKAL